MSATNGDKMTTAMVPMDQMQQMAKSLVASKMFGFKTEAEALSIMLIAQAEGRSPALAARDYHVIQGRPALKADAMLARFQQEGGVVEWDEYTDTKVTGRFSHPESCPKPVAITWTLDMAKRIGLANRDNWRNYPRAMLRSRCVSEGVRTVYPGIAVGIYTVEEVQDMGKEKDITPTAGAGDDLTEDRRVQITDLADKVREWMNSGSLVDAYLEIENAGLENEEYIYLWTHFDSRVRRQLKEEGERQKVRLAKLAPPSGLISDAQKKRLEARIGELKIGRDAVKIYCMDTFRKDHFADLSKDEYEALDKVLDQWAAGGTPPTAGSAPPSAPAAASGPSGAPDALLVKARECAEAGTEVYGAWFDALSAAEQKRIGKRRHDELWAIAESFDRAAA